jgi:hypothetical protein
MAKVETATAAESITTINFNQAGSTAHVAAAVSGTLAAGSPSTSARRPPVTSAARYLGILTVFLVTVLVAAAIFDALIDPYDVLGSARVSGFNLVKPEAENHARLTKPYQIARLRPRAVIVGTSRAEIGLDPENPSWPQTALPVYNFGLPGANLATVDRELKVAGSTGRLELAIILLDFENFLSADAAPDLTPDEDERMAVGDGSQPTAPSTIRHLEDAFLTTLTLPALEDSVLTVLRQQGRYSTDITPAGRWTEAAFEQAAASDGYHELFAQKDADYARRNARAAKFLADRADATPGIEIVRQMLDYCSKRGIRPILVIPPYHADLLEMFDRVGLWDRFENWKIDLVKAVSGSSKSGGMIPQLWDFSGYDRFSTEPVPEQGDRKTIVRWFWEPGHFKRVLGDMLLRRVLDNGPPDFGTELSPAIIGEELLKIRVARESYRNTRASQIARVNEMVNRAQMP